MELCTRFDLIALASLLLDASVTHEGGTKGKARVARHTLESRADLDLVLWKIWVLEMRRDVFSFCIFNQNHIFPLTLSKDLHSVPANPINPVTSKHNKPLAAAWKHLLIDLAKSPFSQ